MKLYGLRREHLTRAFFSRLSVPSIQWIHGNWNRNFKKVFFVKVLLSVQGVKSRYFLEERKIIPNKNKFTYKCQKFRTTPLFCWESLLFHEWMWTWERENNPSFQVLCPEYRTDTHETKNPIFTTVQDVFLKCLFFCLPACLTDKLYFIVKGFWLGNESQW